MPILCGLITSAADSLMTIRTHISSLEHASNSHMQMMCFCYRASTAVGNFNCTENIFKFLCTNERKITHKRRIKLRYQKLMKLIPTAIKKIESALFICYFSFLLFSHRHHHPPLVIQFFSLVTKQRNAIQCDGDHLICELFMFDFKSSPQVLSFIDVKVV